jgi:predicted transcriptional regulator
VDPEKVTVADVMSFELATVREQDGIWETIEFMHAKGVRRLPVLAADGSLAGIVTVDDLLELLSGELSALSGIVKREQVKESQLRR